MEAHPAEGRSGDRAAAPSPAAAASDDAPSYINPAADDIVEQTLGREPWVHESLATSATGASDFVFLDDGKFSRCGSRPPARSSPRRHAPAPLIRCYARCLGCVVRYSQLDDYCDPAASPLPRKRRQRPAQACPPRT